MTKTEKKKIVGDLLHEFVFSHNPENNEHLIEKVILEIYSCGYSSIGQLEIVNKSINLFLKDIVEKTLIKDIKNWEIVSSVVALFQLINISKLPD